MKESFWKRFLHHLLDFMALLFAMFLFSWLGERMEQTMGMGYTMGIFTAIIVHAIYRYSTKE